MAAATADQRLIRCPVCLYLHAIPGAIGPDEYVNCKSCRRPFKVCYALPAREDPNAELDKIIGGQTQGSVLRKTPPVLQSAGPNWPVMFIALLPITFMGSYIVRNFFGPDFLKYFAFVFLATWIGSTAVRHLWRDEWIVSIYAFCLYEGIGLTRVYTSAHPGPRRYEFLIMMMAIGGIFFFLRAKHFENTGGGWSSGCSSCGSSCGGGGCGGGGCGGGGCGG